MKEGEKLDLCSKTVLFPLVKYHCFAFDPDPKADGESNKSIPPLDSGSPKYKESIGKEKAFRFHKEDHIAKDERLRKY